MRERRELYRATERRINAFARELHKIVVPALDFTDSELRRMKCLCVAIGESFRDCYVHDVRYIDAYYTALEIIERQSSRGEK